MRKKPHRAFGAVVATCVGLLLPFVIAVGAEAAPVTVTNGVQFTDSANNVLHGHGGGMIKVDEYYYWFGENPHPDNQFRYISVYRSTDLRNWEFRNNVLTQASEADLNVATVWRPKVIYNARTKQYVMWMRKEKEPGDFTQSLVAVATSSTVDGAYTYRGSFHPLGYRSFDMTVFVDDDDTAYLISTTNESNTNDQDDLTIFRLTPDYLSVVAKTTTLRGVKREAQAMFKRDGVYFMVTSGVTGWQANQAKYATATSIAGPWSSLANLGDSITYGSQSAYVLPVQGSTTTSYLYLGDRHGNAWGGKVKDSKYVWLPLSFPSTRSLSMSWYPEVSIDTETGVVRGVGSGHAYQELRARHSGKCLAVRWSSHEDGAGVAQQDCGTAADQNQHWQVLDLQTGYHQLITRHSNKCLTVPSSSADDGVRVTQRTCGTDANQQWQVTDTGNGYHQLVARHSGKCLDITHGSTTADAQAIQYTCKNTANQQWQLPGAPY